MMKHCESWCLSYKFVLAHSYSIESIPEVTEEMKEIAKLVSRETAKQEELPVTEENEIQCLYQNLFVSLEEARNQTSNTIEPGDISKKIKRLEDDFNKSFTIFTEYNKNPQYGLLMITTSNNEIMHNALRNH